MSDARGDLVPATAEVLGRGAGTRPLRWLVAVTLLLGVLAAVGMIAAAPAGDRTFAGLSNAVQVLMSVTLPFTGVLLARDVLRSPATARLTPALLAAALLAAAVGAAGVLVCAAALAVAPDRAAVPKWDHVAYIALGSVLVQIVAQLVGTGLGLLLRPVAVACLATIVLPLGLWLVLGSVAVLRPAQAWLTPFATVHHLLSGEMSALGWGQWLVVVLVWPVALNAVGAARLTR
ncbi:MAG: hypothetical protein JWO79_1355 [Actinomycetia bacterium]|nr:hypothetical protein [Actinomycetes bacterium]MDQ1656899.1 hypothetical protein [Cryptosporangiaceae bacterium]